MRLSTLSTALLAFMVLPVYAGTGNTSTTTPTNNTATTSKPNSGYNADGTAKETTVPNNRQTPVNDRVDNGGVSKEEFIAYFKKHGRPPNVSRMDFTLSGYTNSLWGYGEWRNWNRPKDGYPRYHYGIDLGTGGAKKGADLRMGADAKVLTQKDGTFIAQRTDTNNKDRFAHHHGLAKNEKTSYKRGEVFSRYWNVKTGDVHDHVEYYALKTDVRMQFRRGIDYNSTKSLKYRSMVDYSKGWGEYRAIDPTPYLPDLYRSNGMNQYMGNTLYTKFNALYGTDLEPSTNTGVKVARPTKAIPNVPLHQIAISPEDLTEDMLLSANMSAISGAVGASGAGFDYSGEMMTQRMLASSFDDTDGETWSATFGKAPPVSINEMTQSQIIKHMATRSYSNPEWLANLGKLSTKGLVMEYLQQQAELNYLISVYKDIKMQSIQQEALLARVSMTGKDKALDGLAEAIHINYNPNFMDIELGKDGDEWVGGFAPSNTPNDIPNGTGVPSEMGGMDTSGMAPKPFRGFDAELDKFIEQASQRYGIDEAYLRGLVKHEDGWTGKDSPTCATGVGQFTAKTWNGLLQDPRAKELGARSVKACDKSANDQRRNREINTMMTAILSKQNEKTLKTYGIPVNPENLYMCHNMGCGYVAYVHGKGSHSAKQIAQYQKNSGYNGAKSKMTLAEFYKYQTRKYRQNYLDANQAGVKK